MKRLLIVLLAALPLLVAARDYPERPIRIIVPNPPGGTADIVARTLAQKLTEAFGQPVVVDNRSGGGNTIGTEIAVRANPDGYTMIVVVASYATNAALYKLPYDPVKDVSAVALIGEVGFVVAVNAAVPVASVKDLIAYDKANPGRLNYGSAGIGSVNHLITELFNQMAGTRMTHVPYKGTSLVLTDLLSGQIQVYFGGMLGMIPQLKSNRLRGIAVTTAARLKTLPELPTVAETVAGYEATSWAAMLGPKGLPAEIVARWNGEINRILQLPEIKERIAGDGMEPVGGPPQRFRAVLARDVAKWRKVVKTGNIKAGD